MRSRRRSPTTSVGQPRLLAAATGRAGSTSSPRTPPTSSTTTARSPVGRPLANGSPGPCPSTRDASMDAFPIEWAMIDEDRGWVVCQVWNRMADVGDGRVHQEYNFTLLKYAGGGRWSVRGGRLQPAPLWCHGHRVGGCRRERMSRLTGERPPRAAPPDRSAADRAASTFADRTATTRADQSSSERWR